MPAASAAAAETLLSIRADLPAWLDFATARAACSTDLLAGPLLAAFVQSSSPLRHMPEALDWLVAWRQCAAEQRCSANPSRRTGTQLDMLRHSFAEADRARQRQDAARVAAAAIGRKVPPGSAIGSRREWTDDALLQHEFTKQKRFAPLRRLLGQAGAAVLARTPCVMMSPLTVAQYLHPDGPGFDLLIIDEASQIRPEDAFGALRDASRPSWWAIATSCRRPTSSIARSATTRERTQRRRGNSPPMIASLQIDLGPGEPVVFAAAVALALPLAA